MGQPELAYQNDVLRKYALGLHYHSRKNWGGRAVTTNGHIVSGAAKGTEDLVMTGNGRALFVECKANTKASPAQEERMLLLLGDKVEVFLSSPRTFKWDLKFLKMKVGTSEYETTRAWREHALRVCLKRVPLVEYQGDMDYFKALKYHFSKESKLS